MRLLPHFFLLSLFLLPSATFADEQYQRAHIFGTWKTEEEADYEFRFYGDPISVSGSELRLNLIPIESCIGHDYGGFKYQQPKSEGIKQDYFIRRYNEKLNDGSTKKLLEYYFVDPSNPNRLIGEKGITWNKNIPSKGIDAMKSNGNQRIFTRIR